MPRLLLRLSKAVIALLLFSSAAWADDYPNRPIRLVVPFPAGGSNDVVGRILAAQLGTRLGQQVFVDNRATAGGIVGTEYVATSPPDGYTLLIISVPHVVNPALHKLRFDPVKSFTPIALLATGPSVLVVTPSMPVHSVAELIALAKKKPGELNYASAGIATFTHLSGELFRLLAGVNILHVPYRGGGPAVQDVLAGHVGIMFSSLIQTAPLIRAGNLRALGVSGKTRSAVLPDVPTIAESGLPGYDASNWWGIVGPADMPAPLVEKLYTAVEDAMKSPQMQEEFAREGATSVQMSSAEFGDYIQAEIEKWGHVVREGHIKAE
jgi:tripartite-type tricarboxylate transporter receptor subunit TctC